MKRKISLVLVFSMILSMSVSMSVFAAKNSADNFKKTKTYQNQFTDVGSSEWYANSVSQAYEYGLVSGNSETTYNPTGNVSIAETIVLACRLNNIYCENNEKFENGEVWYQPYVDYAIKNKIIGKAYTDYNASATRREFAKILSNSLPKDVFETINNVTVIPDVADSEENIYILYNAGILAGNDKYGTFNPTSNIQRSEVAAIIVRIADKTQRKEFKLEEKPVEVESVSLNKTSLSMTAGDKETIKASILPNNATDKTVTYTSTNANVASVSNKGEIKALSQGNATIIVTSSNGKKAECKITVAAAPIEFSGKGNDVITNVSVPYGLYKVIMTNSGNEHFSVVTYDENGDYGDLLANESGSAFYGEALYRDGEIRATNNWSFEIDSESNWTVKIVPITETITSNIKGSKSKVTGLFSGTGFSSVSMTNSGDEHFSVIIYDDTGDYLDLLANDSGSSYNGKAAFKMESGKRYFLVIDSDSNWTVDFGKGETLTKYETPTVQSSNDRYEDDKNDDYYDYDNSYYDAHEIFANYLKKNGKLTSSGAYGMYETIGEVTVAFFYMPNGDIRILETVSGVDITFLIRKDETPGAVVVIGDYSLSGLFDEDTGKFYSIGGNMPSSTAKKIVSDISTTCKLFDNVMHNNGFGVSLSDFGISY